MPVNELLERFGRSLMPKHFQEPIRGYLLKAGYDHVPYPLFGLLFFVSIAITYVAFLAAYPRIQDHALVTVFATTLVFWIVGIGGLVLMAMFFTWTFLNLRIYSRTKEMEEKLPDYLGLVVTNLRSGMSFDKSLWAAIRPEFGVLGHEITIVSKKVMTGNDTSEALAEFGDRYESPILRRSINLIISEIESGGEVASVIERVIDNLRKTSSLKKEMAASVVSYMIFISVIVAVLAPILFALANTILKVIISFAGDIAASGGGISGQGAQLIGTFERLSKVGDRLISEFHIFSYMALGTISLFAGMIVSIIEKGDIKGGLKYIPVFMVTTLVLFYLANLLLGNVFGGMLG